METQEELIPINVAQALLGVSKGTMTRIIKDGQLWTGRDLVDKRIRLVRKRDIDAIAAQSASRKKAA